MTKAVLAVVVIVALIASAIFVACSKDNPTAPPKNRAPVANAGPAQQVSLGQQVFLDGSKSRDPDNDPIKYLWRQTSGTTVSLSDSTSASPQFLSPNSEGVLTFTLTVRDNRGGSSADGTVVLVVSATQPPTANAGADQIVGVSSNVTLHGSGSDPFGGPVGFSWRQYSGAPTVTLSDPGIAAPSFTAPGAAATLSFELTVTDEDNRSALDSVTVTVQDVPPVITPTLYVLNSNSVSGWQNPHTADGNVAPDMHILPDNAQFASPQDIVVDSRGALMVANRGSSITIYNAGNQNGAISPDRSVQGAATGLAGPVSLAIGPSKDILFAGDIRQDGIISFDGVSRDDFDGDVSLSRMFWMQNYELEPGPVSYDEGRDMLYVIETALNQIAVYHSASTRNGASSWSRTITHSSGSVVLTNVFVDAASDRLYVVSRSEKEIYVWDNASAVTGNDGFPTRTFSAGDAPVDIVVDSSNRGYVLDAENAILSFDNVHTLTGAPTPTRMISGGNTLLSSPIALYMYE